MTGPLRDVPAAAGAGAQLFRSRRCGAAARAAGTAPGGARRARTQSAALGPRRAHFPFTGSWCTSRSRRRTAPRSTRCSSSWMHGCASGWRSSAATFRPRSSTSISVDRQRGEARADPAGRVQSRRRRVPPPAPTLPRSRAPRRVARGRCDRADYFFKRGVSRSGAAPSRRTRSAASAATKSRLPMSRDGVIRDGGARARAPRFESGSCAPTCCSTNRAATQRSCCGTDAACRSTRATGAVCA